MFPSAELTQNLVALVCIESVPYMPKLCRVGLVRGRVLPISDARGPALHHFRLSDG